MIIGFEWCAEDGELFGAGCLDAAVDEPAPVNAPDGSGAVGIVRGYEIREGGRSMIVDVELPDPMAVMLLRDDPSVLALGHRGWVPFEYRGR